MSPTDHLLNQSAQWLARTGWDGHGQPSFAAAVEIRARIEACDREIRFGKDQVIKADAKLWTREELAVADNDRITASGKDYRVIKTERFPMVTGELDHLEILLSEVK